MVNFNKIYNFSRFQRVQHFPRGGGGGGESNVFQGGGGPIAYSL